MENNIFMDGILAGPYYAQINAYWQRHNIIDDSSWNLLSCGYLMGYKEAADSLVDQLTSDDPRLDYYVFPIVFLYRQYLELLLKRIYFNRHTKDESIRMLQRAQHNIHILYDFVQVDIEDDLSQNMKLKAVFETLIRGFDDADPQSFNFRYDFDKQLNDTLSEPMTVKIKELRETIAYIDTIFYNEYN